MGQVEWGLLDLQIRLTQPNLPIFNIYFKKYILYDFIVYTFVYQLSWDTF